MGDWRHKSTHSQLSRWMKVSTKIHTPAALSTEKQAPLLGGPHSLSGHFGGEKSLAPARIRTVYLRLSSP